jgi:ABC-type multidrug transport system fused ATPase/permease subunit
MAARLTDAVALDVAAARRPPLPRALDIMMAFPPIMLVLLILAVTQPSLMKTAFAIGVLSAPPIGRVTRSVTLDLMSGEFMEAARARGERLHYVLRRELLPNVWPVLMVEASLRVVFAVLLGAVLSFLGFGVQPPAADWGLMISNGRAFVEKTPFASAGHRDEHHSDRHQPPGRRPGAGPAPKRPAMNNAITLEPVLLEVRNLTVRYGRDAEHAAVRDVSFNLKPGEALGIVGESGSGKSSIAGAILNLLDPSA